MESVVDATNVGMRVGKVRCASRMGQAVHVRHVGTFPKPSFSWRSWLATSWQWKQRRARAAHHAPPTPCTTDLASSPSPGVEEVAIGRNERENLDGVLVSRGKRPPSSVALS